MAYPSGTEVELTLNDIEVATLIEDGNGNDLVTNTFYGQCRPDEIEYLSGATVSYGYDGFRMVSDIDHQDSQSSLLAGFDIERDAMGNPIWVEFTHVSSTGHLFAYDKAGRLTAAQMWSADPSAEAADSDWTDNSYTQLIEFDMDRVGNRNDVTHTAYGQQGVTSDYTFNSVNAYTEIASVSRDHDDNGNLIDNGTNDLSYDCYNNLVKFECGIVTLSEATFDPLNRRMYKSINDEATTIRYVHAGHQVIAEYDEGDNLLREFVYGQGIDQPRVMISPDYADVDNDQNTAEILNFYFHTDYIGSVIAVTGPNETIVEQYEYTPYGVTTIKDGQGSDLSGISAIGNPYMFTARRFDEETLLYHYRHRAYDPSTGRFLQRDPLGYVDGPNLYEYANGTPTALTDPNGTHPALVQVAPRAIELLRVALPVVQHAAQVVGAYVLAEALDLFRSRGPGIDLNEEVVNVGLTILEHFGVPTPEAVLLAKPDIQQVDEVVRKHGLTRGQRDRLHEALQEKPTHTWKELEEAAEEVKELYPND